MKWKTDQYKDDLVPLRLWSFNISSFTPCCVNPSIPMLLVVESIDSMTSMKMKIKTESLLPSVWCGTSKAHGSLLGAVHLDLQELIKTN